MKTYILSQILIISEENRVIEMNNVVRRAVAETEEEALLRFVEATKEMKAIHRLEIGCFDLEELKEC